MTRRQIRTLVAGVALLLLTALGGMARAASPPSPVQIRKVDAGAFPSMAVTVSVASETSVKDFRVAENGSPSTVITVRPLLETGRGVDVVLAIDTSDSVAGAPLEQAVAAARLFVDSLPSQVAVGVLTFSDRATVVIPVTPDHQAVLTALDSLTDTRRGTKLYDGVAEAAKMLSGAGQHNIVLLTDGSDVGSTLSLEGAVEAASHASATVFAVGLGGPHADFAALSHLAEATSGTFQPVSQADLAGLYQSLAEQIGHQYLVLYRSGGPAGAQVTLTVSTPDGEDTSVVLIPRARVAVGQKVDHRPLLVGDWGLALTLGLAFLAALLLAAMVLGGNYRTRRDRTLALRMSAPAWAREERQRQGDGPAAWVPGSVVQLGEAVASAGRFKASLGRKLERAALPVTPGEVVGAAILLSLVAAAAGGLVLRNVVFALIFAVVGAATPFLFVNVKLGKRLDMLQSQLPDILMILASSMRAGHSFQQALDAVAKEIGDPGGQEFARVVTEIRLGRPFDEALNALAERVGTEEFKWAVLGVNVQREVGGNLAEILDTLSETVREREAVRRQVKVLSAEGRLSVKILVVMPFLMALYLSWVNPTYMRLLWTTRPGILFLVVGLVLMVVGAFWSRKSVKIDV